MSTPEERQEAAEYLRENSIGDVVITPYTGHADPIRFPGYKLADLIDPTCRCVPMDAAGKPPFYTGDLALNEVSCGCSKCGYPFGKRNSDIGNPRGVPNFCPNCGARVVDEDD